MNTRQDPIDRLVEESQQGNLKAFSELYDVFFSQIHRYVFYKVSRDQVEDVVSDIFMKVWTQLKKYRKQGSPFRSWVYRIAHNTVIDHYRTHREFYELEEKILDHEEMSPEHHTERSLNGERVHRALRRLGKPYQDAILLKFMNHLSNREIAEMLSVSESNVRTLQHRALRKMRDMLETEEKKLEQHVVIQPSPAPVKVGFLKRIFMRS